MAKKEQSKSGGAQEERSGSRQGEWVLEPGLVLNRRLEIVRRIGRGSIGTVHEVRDQVTGDRLALKAILPEHLAEKDGAEQFLAAFEDARALEHGNIVELFSEGAEEGIKGGPGTMIFYTMEYLEGKSLRELLRERSGKSKSKSKGKKKDGAARQLDPEEAIAILTQVCDALDYAHKTTIHGNLTPGNVMILDDGGVKVMDFCFARKLNHDALRASGASLGKAQYTAPEFRGGAAEADARADVFSLGVMLFEALTGKLPRGYNRICDLRPGLPREYDELISRCLEAPERRIASARAFRDALAECLAAEPEEEASPDSTSEGGYGASMSESLRSAMESEEDDASAPPSPYGDTEGEDEGAEPSRHPKEDALAAFDDGMRSKAGDEWGSDAPDTGHYDDLGAPKKKGVSEDTKNPYWSMTDENADRPRDSIYDRPSPREEEPIEPQQKMTPGTSEIGTMPDGGAGEFSPDNSSAAMSRKSGSAGLVAAVIGLLMFASLVAAALLFLLFGRPGGPGPVVGQVQPPAPLDAAPVTTPAAAAAEAPVSPRERIQLREADTQIVDSADEAAPQVGHVPRAPAGQPQGNQLMGTWYIYLEQGGSWQKSSETFTMVSDRQLEYVNERGMTPGSWRLTGNRIKISVRIRRDDGTFNNAHFSGTFNGQIMRGTAKNSKGKTWRWGAKRQ